MTRVVGLGGGIGASRLWRSLVDAVDPVNVTLVVNTGEDLWVHGLRVCPDLDTTVYALSGRQDKERGWGVRDETWQAMSVLGELGRTPWFNLGDRDLGLHLYRTAALREGESLSGITASVATAFGVACRVLPMTDDEVVTRIGTGSGEELHYQEFLVRDHAEAAVVGVRYEGADRARPAPGVVAAIEAADMVVLGPSNPIASLGPTLAAPGVGEALVAARDRTVAITSVVTGVPITAPAEAVRARSRTALLAALELPPTATGVANHLRPWCRRFVLDRADRSEAAAIEGLGMEVAMADTLLHLGADPVALIDAVLIRP